MFRFGFAFSCDIKAFYERNEKLISKRDKSEFPWEQNLKQTLERGTQAMVFTYILKAKRLRPRLKRLELCLC